MNRLSSAEGLDVCRHKGVEHRDDEGEEGEERGEGRGGEGDHGEAGVGVVGKEGGAMRCDAARRGRRGEATAGLGQARKRTRIRRCHVPARAQHSNSNSNSNKGKRQGRATRSRIGWTRGARRGTAVRQGRVARILYGHGCRYSWSERTMKFATVTVTRRDDLRWLQLDSQCAHRDGKANASHYS